MNSGEFREYLGIQSARLIFELSQPGAINDPKPEHYADAGHVLARSFDAFRQNFTLFNPYDLDDAIDLVNSAVGGFYARDISTHRFTTQGQIGEHPSDFHLVEALKKARDAQMIAEDNGLYKGPALADATSYFVHVLEASRDNGNQDERMRKTAADALRQATRSVPVLPITAGTLLASATHSAQAIVCLAPIAARHDMDTGTVGLPDSAGRFQYGNVPLYKDYLAFHVREALSAIR